MMILYIKSMAVTITIYGLLLLIFGFPAERQELPLGVSGFIYSRKEGIPPVFACLSISLRVQIFGFTSGDTYRRDCPIYHGI